MPTYEYRCPDGHDFELFQRMSDAPAALCPECGKAAERLLSAGGGLLFKGSGFYITDYRSDSYRKGAESESKASSNGEAAGSGGSASGEKAKATPSSSGDSAASASVPSKKGGKDSSSSASGTD